MFRLNADEARALRFQIGTLKRGAHAKYFPYAFTEQGAAGLSGVLRSPRAAKAHVAIMRAFIALRRAVARDAELAKRIARLEEKSAALDADVKVVFDVLKRLMQDPPPQRKRLGFRP